jgi:hypothetical protein
MHCHRNTVALFGRRRGERVDTAVEETPFERRRDYGDYGLR